MDTPHKYTASTDYINNLTFDYVETYSLQRGLEYEENLERIKAEYDRLKVRRERRNNLTNIEEERFYKLDGLLGFTQYVINDKGQFHHSSKKTNTFQANDPIIKRLKDILGTEIKEIPSWMCAPIYRDAIVFYDDNNQIISTLNICLSCQYMETKMFNHINGDVATYDLLKKFFIDIGHNVEDSASFEMDDVDKLKVRQDN